MSRKTNKQKTMIAIHEVINSLEKGEHQFKEDTCSLCILFHNKTYPGYCRGCPFADTDGNAGCIGYLEGIVEEVEVIGGDEYFLVDRIVQETVALTLRLAESFLYRMPNEQFTRKKWKFIDWRFYTFSVYAEKIRILIDHKLRKEV